jgi:carbonic anhydrase
MSLVDDCLAANRAWAARLRGEDPRFFERLRHGQRPQLLWIGCSDSRLVPTEMTGRRPGDVFVHRNVANLVVEGDVNCLSVLEYAVEVLGIRDVVVCGHYGCGGVQAALDARRGGLVDAWLRPLRSLALRHREELAPLDPGAREARLCELNVMAQVANVCRTDIVQGAWASGDPVAVHGWIYSVGDGVLKALQRSAGPADALAFAGEAALGGMEDAR